MPEKRSNKPCLIPLTLWPSTDERSAWRGFGAQAASGPGPPVTRKPAPSTPGQAFVPRGASERADGRGLRTGRLESRLSSPQTSSPARVARLGSRHCRLPETGDPRTLAKPRPRTGGGGPAGPARGRAALCTGARPGPAPRPPRPPSPGSRPRPRGEARARRSAKPRAAGGNRASARPPGSPGLGRHRRSHPPRPPVGTWRTPRPAWGETEARGVGYPAPEPRQAGLLVHFPPTSPRGLRGGGYARAAWGRSCGAAGAASPARSRGLQPRFPRTCGARPPGACAHQAGRPGRPGPCPERPWREPLALQGPRGQRLALRPPGDAGLRERLGLTGPPDPGRARPGSPSTAQAPGPAPWLARPPASHQAHGIGGMGDAADCAGNFSLSPYFLPPVASASWPHTREPSQEAGSCGPWAFLGGPRD